MPRNKNIKKNVARDGYDYYSILGFSDKSSKERRGLTKKEIMKAYTKQLKHYDPNRIPKNISEKEFKMYRSMYRLVQEAGDVLTDKNRRKAYDLESTMKDSGGFLGMKHSYDEYRSQQDDELTEEAREKAQLEFDRGGSDFSRKHGLDKFSSDTSKKDEAMSLDEATRRFEDLVDARSIQEMELEPKEMFPKDKDGNVKFDNNSFQRAFQKRKMKESRRRGKGNELMSYADIDSFANDGLGGPGIGVNDSYDDLYAEDDFEGNGVYGRLDGDDDSTDDDLDSVDSADIDDKFYKMDGAMNRDTLDDILNARKQEREDESKMYSDKNYKGWKSSMEDKFGPSNGLGFVVGTDQGGVQQRKVELEQLDDEDIDAYAHLLGYDTNYDTGSDDNDTNPRSKTGKSKK